MRAKRSRGRVNTGFSYLWSVSSIFMENTTNSSGGITVFTIFE